MTQEATIDKTLFQLTIVLSKYFAGFEAKAPPNSAPTIECVPDTGRENFVAISCQKQDPTIAEN